MNCDRCGNKIRNKTGSIMIIQPINEEAYYRERKILCNHCESDLRYWLKVIDDEI